MCCCNGKCAAEKPIVINDPDKVIAAIRRYIGKSGKP